MFWKSSKARRGNLLLRFCETESSWALGGLKTEMAKTLFLLNSFNLIKARETYLIEKGETLEPHGPRRQPVSNFPRQNRMLMRKKLAMTSLKRPLQNKRGSRTKSTSWLSNLRSHSYWNRHCRFLSEKKLELDTMLSSYWNPRLSRFKQIRHHTDVYFQSEIKLCHTSFSASEMNQLQFFKLNRHLWY